MRSGLNTLTVLPSGAVEGTLTSPPDIAVVVLTEAARGHRLWAWWRFLWGRYALYRTPGLRFAKVLGSGFEGGFGLRPSFTRHGLLCVFSGSDAADAFLASPWLSALEGRTKQWCWLKLQAFSSKGCWSGRVIAAGAPAPQGEPVASLTRASIRWSRLLHFWRLSPPAEASLSAAPGCTLAVGLGEAPLLRQATFSVWNSLEAMNAYARSGAHQQAISRAYGGRYFSESMFVRWRVLARGGVWSPHCRAHRQDGEAEVRHAA